LNDIHEINPGNRNKLVKESLGKTDRKIQDMETVFSSSRFQKRYSKQESRSELEGQSLPFMDAHYFLSSMGKFGSCDEQDISLTDGKHKDKL
jgi:hypothetical protein